MAPSARNLGRAAFITGKIGRVSLGVKMPLLRRGHGPPVAEISLKKTQRTPRLLQENLFSRQQYALFVIGHLLI
jgi:hypothetical protein